jgi:mannosyl-3-phosphoglycerate phosphatase
MARKFIIFTDLDATLLDHFDYSWEAALPGLQLAFQKEVPIIICSSKTRSETIYFRGQIGIKDPFIVENGGAIYVPLGTFPESVSGEQREGYEVIALGVPYGKLREALVKWREELGIDVVGFGDLDVRQIQEVTGLPEYLAEAAAQREFDEPFFFRNPEDRPAIEDLRKRAAEKGWRITEGGRFFHLCGPHSKGEAVRRLIRLYRKFSSGSVVSVAIGDSLNDLPMLKEADIPCLVARPRGGYEGRILNEMAPRLSNHPGPQGWSELVTRILEEE